MDEIENEFDEVIGDKLKGDADGDLEKTPGLDSGDGEDDEEDDEEEEEGAE